MASKSDYNSKKSKNRIIKKDVSDGKELLPIPVINNVNDEVPLFNYILKNTITKGVEDELMEESGAPPIPRGCDCHFDNTFALCGENCECENKSLVCFDPKNRIVVDPMSYNFYDEFYIECGTHCGCQGRCKRRILPGSHALKKLHVEYVDNKGFGVIVDQPVAAGMPVCEYRGLVCMVENDKVGSSHYQEDLLLDNKGLHFCVDAVHHGNVARLINHSCAPNLVQVMVYASIPSPRKLPPMPRVALVACRDILPDTELTFNYGAEYFVDRGLRCFCYELCCLIPPDDWGIGTKNRAQTEKEFATAKRQIQRNFRETKDIEQPVIELDDD